MKRRVFALLLICAVTVMARNVQQQNTNERVAGIKLNWLEQRYRRMSQDRISSAERRVKEAQDKLTRLTAAPEHGDQQKEIDRQKADIGIYEKELQATRDQMEQTDALLARVVTDKQSRKIFNKELRAALQKENEQTAAENAAYRSTNRYPSSTFIVKCYSGGFGRYFWVRCTSSWY